MYRILTLIYFILKKQTLLQVISQETLRTWLMAKAIVNLEQQNLFYDYFVKILSFGNDMHLNIKKIRRQRTHFTS